MSERDRTLSLGSPGSPGSPGPVEPEVADTRAQPATPGAAAPHSGREILARLLARTPPPPAAETDADQLLAAFAVIIAEREAVIAQIAPPLPLTDADRELLVELVRRQDAWHDALTAAQRTALSHRHGAAQLRAYARRP
ncbi:MAG TPA: hypothetical protein VFK02_23150 [Kofleriaceae bacterium]|nr:hypothetical protein [Kofleriaceae bacterium]